MYRIAKVLIQSKYIVPTPFPEWNSLPFPYFFLTLWPTFPTNFTWNCVKSFYLQRIFRNIGYERTFIFFNNLVLSVVKYPPFCFWIFHNFENLKFPTFSWPFDPFPNPSWLCQPIPYLFKTLNFLIWFQSFSRFSLPVEPIYISIRYRALMTSA